MANNVQERFTPYLVANANQTCFTGAGCLAGIFVSSASNTPLLTVLDSASAVDANANNANMRTVAAQFVPAAATYYKLPADCLNGLTLVVGGNITCTVFANKG